jgi:pyruvate formate lyase activating enzyme
MAVELVEAPERREVKVYVDGERAYVPEGVTVLKALELLGFRIAKFPGEGDIFAPCGVGGCYSCAVEVDGCVRPSCVTKVEEGMRVSTRLPEGCVPVRLVHGWMGHPVGGVGRPGGSRVGGTWRLQPSPAAATFGALSARTGRRPTAAGGSP